MAGGMTKRTMAVKHRATSSGSGFLTGIGAGAFAALTLAAVACAGSTSDPRDLRAAASPGECRALARHVVELRLRAGTGDGGASLDAHRANLLGAAGDAYLSACQRDRSVAYVACALDAADVDGLRACDEPEVLR